MKINKGWGGMRILAVAIHFSLAAAGMIATGFAAEAQNLISNGDFEITHKMTDVVASEDRGFGSWQVGANRQVPDTWLLNPAYPGTGTVVEEGAYSGRKFLHINSNIAEKTRRGAHLYHPCPAIKAGKCYRVTARIRGGAANIGFYEYHKDAPFRADVVCMGTAAPNEWREISGYYRPVGAGFESAYLAVMIPWGQKVDVDSVSVEEVSTQKVNPAMKPILVENDVMRMELSPLATFEHFVCKETGVDYALPRSICYVNLNGTSMQAQTLSRRGDLVDIRFPDPDVKISLRIKAQDRYFTFEVMDMQPANLSSMTLEFPMKRLATQGIFFSANYDDTFAACAFALNYKAFCLIKDHGKTKDSTTITADFIKEYGIKGGKIALLGTPRKQFGALIQKVERDAGLPSPVLDGKWLRESEPMRRSYLFVTDIQILDIESPV